MPNHEPPLRDNAQYEADKAAGINPLPKSGIVNSQEGSTNTGKSSKDDLPPDNRIFPSEIIQAAKDAADKLEKIWLSASNRKSMAILEAARNRTFLPDNYWQDEYRARQAYNTALNLYYALTKKGS